MTQEVQTTKQDLKQLIQQEYVKCANDVAYFIKRYCHIVHQIRGRLPFIMYDFQENVLASFKKHNRVIILKNRQMGISTLIAAYALWIMTFNENKYILVIATKQDVAKKIIDKVRFMWQNLPSWMRLKCKEDNRLSQIYTNGSQIYAGTTADSGRADAAALLVIDECAHIPIMDSIWSGLQPTISTGGDIIILSTPNGIGNFFHQTFTNAEIEKNNFYPITLHWTMHPERNQAWRDEQDIELGPRLAAQECDADWLTSGDTVIPGEILEYYNNTFVQEPGVKTEYDNNMWICEQPVFTKNYILSADVARGDGEDYSAFHIFDIANVTQVAEYQDKISTGDFGNLLVEYAVKYNDALIVIENNPIGWAVIQRVLDRKYHNLFYSDQKVKVVDTSRPDRITNKLHTLAKKSVPGFNTNSSTRPAILSKMQEYFLDRI